MGCWGNAPAAQNQTNSAQRWQCLQVHSPHGVVGEVLGSSATEETKRQGCSAVVEREAREEMKGSSMIEDLG